MLSALWAMAARAAGGGPKAPSFEDSLMTRGDARQMGFATDIGGDRHDLGPRLRPGQRPGRGTHGAGVFFVDRDGIGADDERRRLQPADAAEARIVERHEALDLHQQLRHRRARSGG